MLPPFDFGERRFVMAGESFARVSRPKGLLIALEGIDGTGKSLQAKLLAEYLNHRSIVAEVYAEPTNGPKGREIRRLSRSGRLDPQAEFHLFLEDRQEDVEQNIRPALLSGKVVIMDRYYISSIAYQGARGLDPRIIQIANERVAPRPDLIFLMEIDVEKALERIHAREKEEGPNLFEHAEYLKQVDRIFKKLNWQEIQRIDGAQTPEAIQRQVREHVDRKLAAAGPTPAAQ